MAHFGVICPNAPGHLNPMVALADSLRTRGHQITFFQLGDPSGIITQAGFEVMGVGGTIYPADDYRADIVHLGTLQGRAALKHTFHWGKRSAAAILGVGPDLVRKSGVTALIVDQASTPGGTVAEELGLPFVTVCNALLLNPDPIVPPFFTHWAPRQAWWAKLRNRLAWAGLNRMYAPILGLIQKRRKELGLSIPQRIADGWSSRLQISQQPEPFEFPRSQLPSQVRFVGPLRLSQTFQAIPFPWDRLDGRPLIYASLGTLQNRVVGTFQAMAQACAGLDAQLVISTGGGMKPEALGQLPGDPIIVHYAPQLDLLKKASLAVTHAGLNTVLDALTFGVPMVAMPVTNEQPGIAQRIAWVGAGEVITQKKLNPALLRSLIEKVLSQPSYRVAARRISESIQKAGGATRTAELIEEAIGNKK